MSTFTKKTYLFLFFLSLFSISWFGVKAETIDLVSISATKGASAITITWITSMEVDIKEYVIERSYTGTSYHNITSIGGVENSTSINVRQFNDFTYLQNFNGTIYYRLKNVNFDGSIEYSAPTTIKLVTKGNGVAKFNNPVVNDLELNVDEPGTLELYDLAGKQIMKMTNVYGSVDMSTVKTGYYVVRFITKSGQKETAKVFVQ